VGGDVDRAVGRVHAEAVDVREIGATGGGVVVVVAASHDCRDDDSGGN
jgi:hypothetical protein